MWFPDYIEEIECDFSAIYHQPIGAMWRLGGRNFVRFASRLPWYEGAVRGKITKDYQETTEEGGVSIKRDPKVESRSKITMSEAMGRVAGDDLSALNYESQANDMGDLFERVTVPGN